MSKPVNLREELQAAIDGERRWRDFIRSGGAGDTGSYCESADQSAIAASEVARAYSVLVDKLMTFERQHS